MGKFKVGDLVRIRKDSRYFDTQGEELGIGRIAKLYDESNYSVKSVDSRYSNSYDDDDLELANTVIHPRLKRKPRNTPPPINGRSLWKPMPFY